MFLILGISIVSKSQKLKPKQADNELNTLLKQTSYIMGKLKIKKRTEIRRDGTLQILINEQLPYGAAAAFKFLPKLYWNDDLTRRYYPSPIIYVRPERYNIIKQKKDTTRIEYLRELSGFVHEIAHYFQTTELTKTIPITNYEEWRAYVQKPAELEAHAVQAYYFLWFHDKNALRKIMIENKKAKILHIKLINASLVYFSPEYAMEIPLPNQ